MSKLKNIDILNRTVLVFNGRYIKFKFDDKFFNSGYFNELSNTEKAFTKNTYQIM
jgi:hypothetical protein